MGAILSRNSQVRVACSTILQVSLFVGVFLLPPCLRHDVLFYDFPLLLRRGLWWPSDEPTRPVLWRGGPYCFQDSLYFGLFADLPSSVIFLGFFVVSWC